MHKFTLMHQNNPVAHISLQKDSVGRGYLHVDNIINTKELPYGLKNEKADRMSMSMTWWNNTRCIPLGRPNYEKMLSHMGLTNSSELLPYTYMCSLTDCYWFKPFDSYVAWEDVNFRDNGFSSNLYRYLFYDENNIRINTLNSPDLTTDGALPKMWIERDDTFYLVKSSMTRPPIDVYNEIIANEILNQLNLAHTPYFLEEINGITASVCPCFIQDNTTEFVQAESLILDGYYDSPNNYLNTMRHFGYQNEIDSMILTDMIIGNIDRHSRNYGQIIDTATQKVMGAAPIFDNGGCTFLSDVSQLIYKPTNKTFEETTLMLNNDICARAECIDLQAVFNLVDSFPLSIQNKSDIKSNLDNRVSHIIELSRGIDHDFDRNL